MHAPILRSATIRAWQRCTGTLALLLTLFLAARTVEITIFQTTDTHANLLPHSAGAPGWLALGPHLERLLQECGRDHCLLIDCGDTSQGTLLGALSRGSAGLTPLLLLSYDVWVPGNHDFDFGPERFFENAAPLRHCILAANLFPPPGQPALPGWKMFERQGARIAVIGATASYMHSWFSDALLDGCRVEYANLALKRLMPEILHARPDCIVLAIHQDWSAETPRQLSSVAAMARDFPEIDLVLGGHSHRPHPGRKIGSRTWYVQATDACETFAIVQVQIDTVAHEVLAITSKLQKNTAVPDPSWPQLEAAESTWLTAARAAATEIIIPPLPYPLLSRGRPGIDCQASELFCLAFQQTVGCQVAFHGTLSKKNFAGKKAITRQDLFDFVPYENTLVTARLTPTEIAAIAWEQWQNRSSYTFCGIWGAEITINQKSAQVNTIAGQPIPPDCNERFLTAFNNFTTSGRYPVLKKILALEAAETTDTGFSTRTIVENFLRRNPALHLTPTLWLKQKP